LKVCAAEIEMENSLGGLSQWSKSASASPVCGPVKEALASLFNSTSLATGCETTFTVDSPMCTANQFAMQICPPNQADFSPTQCMKTYAAQQWRSAAALKRCAQEITALASLDQLAHWSSVLSRKCGYVGLAVRTVMSRTEKESQTSLRLLGSALLEVDSMVYGPGGDQTCAPINLQSAQEECLRLIDLPTSIGVRAISFQYFNLNCKLFLIII
jgi:hypothetical protein